MATYYTIWINHASHIMHHIQTVQYIMHLQFGTRCQGWGSRRDPILFSHESSSWVDIGLQTEFDHVWLSRSWEKVGVGLVCGVVSFENKAYSTLSWVKFCVAKIIRILETRFKLNCTMEILVRLLRGKQSPPRLTETGMYNYHNNVKTFSKVYKTCHD